MTDLERAQLKREAKLLDEHIERQLDLLLSAKDVGPHARYKLRNLLKYYAKKRHPFRACVRDNMKRFGPGRTEAVCATLKDIIRGTTHWRGKGNKRDKGVAPGILAYDEIVDLLLSIPDDELEEIYHGELQLQAYADTETPAEEGPADEADFPPDANHRVAEDPAASCGVCANFDAAEGMCMFYGASTTPEMTSNAFVSQAEGEQLAASFEHNEGMVVLGEFFLEQNHDLELAEAEDDEEEADGIWKVILRTGTWKTRPGPGGTVLKKPLHVSLDGPVKKGQVSLRKLVDAFEDGAVEHVTIPLSHKDQVNENTGQVKALRIIEEDDGNARLEGLHVFTDPEVRQKVLNRSILNTSCGIVFDHIRRRDGKKYEQALDHVSLTNKPWIDGLPPFGEKLAASQGDSIVERVLLATPDDVTHDIDRGGESMGDYEHAESLDALTERLGLSIEEIEDRINRSEDLEKKLQARDVNDKAKAWVAEGVPPAVVEEAKAIMLADDGGPALLLAQEEDGDIERLTASDIVDRIVAKVPRLELSVSHGDRDTTENHRPNDDASAELPRNVKTRAVELQLENITLSDEEAIDQARLELGVTT